MIEGTGFSGCLFFRTRLTSGFGGARALPWLATAIVVLSFIMGAGTVVAQALTVQILEGGTEVVLVTETLAEMSSGCWPVMNEKQEWVGRCVVGSDLTFTAELEAALGNLEEAPPVMIIVGGSGRREAIDRARRVLAGKAAGPSPPRQGRTLSEGGQERRLGQPGGASILRLELQIPPVDSPDRTAVEVLWNLLPRYLSDVSPGLRAGIDGDIGTLEFSNDGDIGDLQLRSLRLALAQVAGAPSIEAAEVEREANRLRIGRSAQLESVEQAGLDLLDLWIRGGVDGIRQYLFGPDGVTLERVRNGAGQWLPRHPGHAIFVLPPRHFRPRFAPGPEMASMANDLSVAVLARPSAHLAALVLRPILLSDLAGDAEAVVLTRLATALRRSENRPAHIDVETRPPRLELAAEAGDFPDLCEALQAALEEVAADANPATVGAGARRNALRLMAGLLGLDAGTEVSPASVLAPGNLAVGGVAEDAELAIEALEKFEVGGSGPGIAPSGLSVGAIPRHRIPAAGSQSAVAVALPLVAGFPIPQSIAELITGRASRMIEGSDVEVFLPLIPGRQVMVLLVVRDGGVDELEDFIRKQWASLFSQATEEELKGVRRNVAANVVAASSGVLGRARVCAAIAAGADSWRTPSEREMSALTVDLVAINLDLERLAAIAQAEWTASGPATVTLGEN